jgi:hypothetical protein
MKTTKTILPFLIAILFAFSACTSKDPVSPATPTCNIQGTLKNNICGVGVWGAYVIELEDGTILQPWDASLVSSAIKGFVPQADKKITFAYEKMTKDDRYANTITCSAIPIYSNTTPIKFTCFQ